MAYTYRGGDRTQPFLIAPDMRDWLPEGHLVWLVLDFVEMADTSVFHRLSRRGGAGRRRFDPDVLLALLVYAYATGQRSSRKIERACETDVACRVIMGNEVPDHTVVARFRKDHQDAFAGLFVQLLEVCAAQGMGQVGTIAVDGTKIAADASRLANRSREALRAEIDAILAEAETVDAAEDTMFGDARGDELPDGLAAGADRIARLRACLADLDQAYPQDQGQARLDAARRRVDELQQQVDEMSEQRAAYEADVEAGVRGRNRPLPPDVDGPPPRPSRIADKRRALDNAYQRLSQLQARPVTTGTGNLPTRNTTDPDSRIMKSQGAWIQGYNAQAAVSADGLIVAADVTNQAADTVMFTPMLQQIETNLAAANIDAPVRALLLDAGYASDENLTCPGPPRLIPPPDKRAGPAATAMRRRLEQPAMVSLYKRRTRVERTFGRIKHNQGIRRFTRRGLPAAHSEWQLICLGHNLNALHRRRQHQPPPRV